jgi:Coenzyme PQQ synthesis protein D (PqqD)
VRRLTRPVKETGIRQLLRATTTVALAPHASLAICGLKTRGAEVVYKLNPAGRVVLEQLLSGRSVEEIAQDISHTHGLPSHRTIQDLEAFLGELDDRALISVHKSYLAQWRDVVGALLSNVLPSAMLYGRACRRRPRCSCRHKATAFQIGLVILESQVFSYILTLVMVAVVSVIRMALAGPAPSSKLQVGSATLIRSFLALNVFLWLFCCHEWGHLGALRCLRVPVHYVSGRIGRVGLAHDAKTGSQAITVAMAGPIVAFAVAITIAVCFQIHPVSSLGVGHWEATYTVLFGVAHLWSLRPWTGDGRMAMRSLVALIRDPRSPGGSG